MNTIWEKRIRVACVLATTSCAAIAGFPAFAQGEDDESIEEIFVVGDRRAYQGAFDEFEKPSASQSLNLELLRDVGALNLDQALDLSASVSRQNNFGGLWNSFSIRGFSGDINLPSGFLVNGFDAGRGFAGPRDLAGIETVEVLKGPRAAVYGRGEPGGTINLVTKRPQFQTGGDVRLTLGSWQQTRFEGDFQSALGADDNVGVRIVGFYEDAESFRETVETKRVGFYPSVTWRISDNTRTTYELEYTQQDVPFDRGVAYTEGFGFSPRKTFTGEPSDGPIDTEVVGHQLEIQHNFSDDWSVLAGFGFRDTTFKGNASETNFLGRQTLIVDGQTLSRFYRARDFDTDYTVVRAELAGAFNTGSLRHRLLFGVDDDSFEQNLNILRFRAGFIGSDPNSIDIGSLDPAAYLLLDVLNPVYGQYAQPVPGPNTDRKEELNGTGVYIQDQIDVTEKLQVRLGLRWDDFSQDLTNLRANPVSTLSTSDTRVSPQIGAVYIVNDGFSLYASYGEGFRQQTGSDFQGNQFEPNITESAEIGFKADVQNFVDGATGMVTLTLFQVDQSNILVNDDRPQATAAGFFLFAAGEARSRGLEFDTSFETDEGTRLWLSYAYTDAEYTTSNLEQSGFGAVVEVGDALINSPEHQLNIQASKTFEMGGKPMQLGGGVLYTGEREGFTGFDFILPSYTTVRLFGQYEPTERLQLRVDIDNALDEVYYTNSFADVWVGVGAPRRYRLSAAYSF